MAEEFGPLKMPHMHLTNHDRPLYRLWLRSGESKDIEAESASEALEKSDCKEEVIKIEFMAFNNKIFIRDNLHTLSEEELSALEEEAKAEAKQTQPTKEKTPPAEKKADPKQEEEQKEAEAPLEEEKKSSSEKEAEGN